MSDWIWRGVWNCPTQRLPLLRFECPQSWDKLEGDDPSVRRCPACRKDVHLCRTPEEFVSAAEQGHCVAIPDPVHPLELTACVLGEPSPEEDVAFKDQVRSVAEWWRVVIERAPPALGHDP